LFQELADIGTEEIQEAAALLRELEAADNGSLTETLDYDLASPDEDEDDYDSDESEDDYDSDESEDDYDEDESV
jgi:hypothetical protein